MSTFAIYCVLIAFLVEHSFRIDLSNILGMGRGLSFQNISLYFLLIAWIINCSRKRMVYEPNGLNKYIILLLFITTVSIPIKMFILDELQINTLSELVGLKNWVEPWFVFFIIFNIVSDKEHLKKAISALNILVVVTLLVAILEMSGISEIGTQGSESWHRGRVAGFSEPNQYAAFLVLLAPLILSPTIFQGDILKRVASAGSFFILIIGLIGTVSRGGFAAFLVGMACFGIMLYRKKIIRRINILLLAVVVPMVVSTSFILIPSVIRDTAVQRIVDPTDPAQATNPWATEQTWLDKYSTGRVSLWVKVIRVIFEHPIIGHGHDADNKQLNLSTHNDYLKYLLNYGIIGFVIFVMMYIHLLRHFNFCLRRSKDPYSIRIYASFICGFLGYLVAMFAVNIYDPRLIFWIYTALVYKYSYLDKSERDGERM